MSGSFGTSPTGGSEINQLVTRPAAQPGDQEGMKIVRETIQAGEHESVAAREGVVREHGRNGNEQPRSGRDQRLADRPCNLVEDNL